MTKTSAILFLGIQIRYWGAGGFGALIGWYIYYINRYRKSDVQLGDITTVIGAVGGAAVTGIFGRGNTDLFGAYGIGLATGFFGYFLVLTFLVGHSEHFDSDWFLDGRRIRPQEPSYVPGDVAPTVHPQVAMPEINAQSAAISTAITATASAIGETLQRARQPSAQAQSLTPMGRARDIVDICKAEWPMNKSDCSAFVRTVASVLMSRSLGTRTQSSIRFGAPAGSKSQMVSQPKTRPIREN
jgi:hypothetical protein